MVKDADAAEQILWQGRFVEVRRRGKWSTRAAPAGSAPR